MRCVDPDESVPEALERVLLEWRLDAQYIAFIIQPRLWRRGLGLVFVKDVYILYFEPIDPKPHRDCILWVQSDILMFQCTCHSVNVGQRDEFVAAAIGR
jgi:hypothetical protein